MIVGNAVITINAAGTPLVEDRLITEEDVPRDALSKLLPAEEPEARVTIGMSLSDKSYGKGLDVHCSVQLACCQDGASLETAARIATGLAADFVGEAFDVAVDTYNQVVTS